MHEKSKKNESIVVNIEEILPCTTCVGLTFAVNGKEVLIGSVFKSNVIIFFQKTVKSMANFNYSEHASHIDNFNSVRICAYISEIFRYPSLRDEIIGGFSAVHILDN